MIYFIRHGESEANIRHVFAGQKDDSILTKKGEEQALATAKEIKKEKLIIDKIISSPLKRASKTAEIIAIELGFDISKIITDKHITEYDMGSLTGTKAEDISSLMLTTAKNAEDPQLFCDRVCSYIKKISESSENILIVSHAGVGRILESIKEGKEPSMFYDISAYENASVTKIDWIK